MLGPVSTARPSSARCSGQRSGGAWTIAPTGPAQVERRYLDRTNILETRFQTATGEAVLTDFMPAIAEEKKRPLNFYTFPAYAKGGTLLPRAK
jgi:hypothetical protein